MQSAVKRIYCFINSSDVYIQPCDVIHAQKERESYINETCGMPSVLIEETNLGSRLDN